MSGIFAKAFGEKAKNDPEKRESIEMVFEKLHENHVAAAGITSPDTALRMAAVFACTRILSETIASLPLIIYERLERGKRRAQEFYLYELLHDRPNSRMTALEYRETIQSHLVLWGNAYSRIIYDSQGRIEELWPLLPGGMIETKVLSGVKYYGYQDPSNGKITWYSEGEIWHLHGLGDDGEQGYSPISLMRRAVQLGMSAEAFGDNFFENDARPGVILEHPGVLSDQAHKNLRTSWEEEYKGAEKSHKPMVLEEGVKLHEVGIPPEDAQFLETRKFQIQEIARIFRVPPHMLADLDRATFSNIEQMSMEFVMYSLRPWLVRWEQSIQQVLMLPDERKRYYCEHLVEGLLRGDIQTRYSAYATGRQNGWLSANDIREFENMNPIDGGDEYLVPLNMVAAGSTEPVNVKPTNSRNNSSDGGE